MKKSSKQSVTAKGHYQQLPPVSPDGGWGWVVVCGCFFIHLIADGVAYSFGVFLIEFIDYFDVGRGELGWIGSIMVGCTLGSGPICSILANKFGCRAVAISGGVLAASAFVISIVATNVYVLYATFGVMAGLGLGMIYLPAIVSVTVYFEKRRAMATGMAVCGSGVGTFIFAPLSKSLIDSYGWKGAALIEAGLLLNCCVCGSLFRPLRGKKVWVPASEPETRTAQLSKSEPATSLSASTPSLQPPVVYMPPAEPARRLSDVELTNVTHPQQQHLLPPTEPRRRTVSETTQGSPRKAVPSGSLANVSVTQMYHTSMNSLSQETTPAIATTPSKQRTVCCSPEVQENMKSILDFTLLKNPLFLMFAISNFATSIGFNVPYIFLPDRAVLLGIGKAQAAFLISVIGIANTCGRVVFGWLSDRKCVNRQMLYNTSLTVCGLLTALSAYCNVFPWLVAYAASFGLFIGVYVSLTSVVLVDLLGIECLTSSFGLLLMFQGGATLIGPPIAGWVFDATQSYDIPFFITGGMIAFSGVMLYPIPLVKRYMERKEPKENGTLKAL